MDPEGNWYVKQKVQGPLAWSEVRAWAKAGRLKPDMALSQDEETWAAASTFSDLFQAEQEAEGKARISSWRWGAAGLLFLVCLGAIASRNKGNGGGSPSDPGLGNPPGSRPSTARTAEQEQIRAVAEAAERARAEIRAEVAAEIRAELAEQEKVRAEVAKREAIWPPNTLQAEVRLLSFDNAPTCLMWDNLGEVDWTHVKIIINGQFRMTNNAECDTKAGSKDNAFYLSGFRNDRGLAFNERMGVDMVEIRADQGVWRGKLTIR